VAAPTRTSKLDARALDELEVAIEDLRLAFERYFIGIDRVAPQRKREDLDREIKRMSGRGTANTAVRFRLDALRGRFVTYDQHWRRILRDIENGTFVRVVAESERRKRLLAAEKQRERTLALSNQMQASQESADENLSAANGNDEQSPVNETSSPSEGRPKPGGARPPPAAPARLPEGIDAAKARALFKAYVAAKKENGESIDGLSYSGLVNKLAAEIPRLSEAHGKAIEFDVSREGGKVRLVARVRK
jgi:hypothetical protein